MKVFVFSWPSAGMQNANRVMAAGKDRMMMAPFGRTTHDYGVFYSMSRRRGVTDGLQRSPGRAHPAPAGPAQEHRRAENVRWRRLPAPRQPTCGHLEGLPLRAARLGTG